MAASVPRRFAIAEVLPRLPAGNHHSVEKHLITKGITAVPNEWTPQRKKDKVPLWWNTAHHAK
ncbi:MAG: hypothetical protein LAO30_02395 [Acidobacteriia bacterium]|nr:hypothetical protein [Terriglobia bacterium]